MAKTKKLPRQSLVVALSAEDEQLRSSLPFRVSPRQFQVLRLVMYGKSTAEIATALHVLPGTVKVHVQSLFRAASVSSRVELYPLARFFGLPVPTARLGVKAQLRGLLSDHRRRARPDAAYVSDVLTLAGKLVGHER